MIRSIDGDLIALAKAGGFDVIVHGCNCFHTMGAGLAAQIRTHFPAAYEADLATAHGERAKLGTCSSARIEVGSRTLHVVNAYTQHHHSGPGPRVDYAAVRGCMQWVKARHSGRRIGLPRIGAGLAGGDWPTLEAIIREVLGNEDVTIVTWNPIA